VVRGALAQRWPEDRVEVLVVDGRSTDATREIVGRLAADDPRVRLLDNPSRYQSAGMNVAIRASRGDVIVRMDAHAEYADDFVEASVRALRVSGAMNAGGAARPKAKGFFQRAVCAALGSPLGVGGSKYRNADNEGYVESVWGGAFRREVFEIAGMYDPKAITNEDAELNQRIIEAGFAIYLSKDVVAYYYPRSSLGGLLRQYHSYGKGRARTVLARGKLLSLRPVIPFVTVTAFAALGGLSVAVPAVSPLLAALACVYGAAVVAEAVRVARRDSFALLPLLVIVFPAIHAAHGVGFWSGLLAHIGSKLGALHGSAPARWRDSLAPQRRAEITQG
jgi:glycosyltransferase involved in cell wall biosynthesis